VTVREQIEQRERETLSRYAMLVANSRGRVHNEPEHPFRTAFQRDRDRIIHSKAFRRLKQKTQVFLAPERDHYRTRLTHTLEVAQIARTAARALFLNEDLTEAIALAHDLGHAPFGHAGEFVLDELCSEGFNHTAQSLRIVEKLESTHRGPGLNLTFEVRDGIANHSKGKSIILGKKEPSAATLEGDIVAICDAVAYINHDIDDALRGGILRASELPAAAIKHLGATSSERIDSMVQGIIEASKEGAIGIVSDVRESMCSLRRYLYSKVYPCETIHREVEKAKKVLRELYAYLLANPPEQLLPGENDEDTLERKIVDFIAGMTDPYALELYHRFLLPTAWKI
jgi:dGTPase